MKTVTVYTTSDYPNGGPAENFVRYMVQGLYENGMKLNVILINGHYENTFKKTDINCNTLFFKKKPKNEILKFIQIIINFFLLFYSILKNRIKNKTYVFLLYGVEYFYLVLPFLLIGIFTKIRVFRIITDRYPDELISPKWWKKPKILLYKIQYKYFDRFLSGIICLSDFLRTESIKNGVKEDKTLVIPHFIDIKYFENNNQPFKNKKIRIGMCGTLNIQNGILDLIEAFKLLNSYCNDVELLLVGTLKDDIKIKISNILNEKMSSVIITGKVEHSEVPYLLSTCDILVNPRKCGIVAEAGFPTKLGEYFATKKPVVATSVGDIKKYFTNKKELVLVECNSINSLLSALIFLIENNDIARDIANNGYLWAKNNLDYRISTQKLINFIFCEIR